MPAPIPRVLFPWHIADREESTKCGGAPSLSRNTVIPDSRMITSPALRFTQRKTCSRGRYYVPARAIVESFGMRNGPRKKNHARCLKTLGRYAAKTAYSRYRRIRVEIQHWMEINFRDEFIDPIVCGKLGEARKEETRPRRTIVRIMNSRESTGRKWDNYLIINNLLRN